MSRAIVTVEQGATVMDGPLRTVRAICEHPLLDATWSRYAAGERGPALHVHHRHVDAFYVVEGELEFQVGPTAAPVRAPAGTFVLVPPGIVHTFHNASGATARWLNLHAPSTGFLAWLRGEHDAFDSDDPPADGGVDPSGAIVTIAGPHDRLGSHPLLSATEIALEPGRRIELRTHSEALAAFLVLEGEVEVGLAGVVARADPGTWLAAPPGIEHGIDNRGPRAARVLYILAPGVHEATATA